MIGLSFFIAKIERGNKSLFLLTLGMNGHLRLWMGTGLQSNMGWNCLHAEYINRNLAGGSLTDSGMLLKRSREVNQEGIPFFVIYVPSDGFRVYNVVKGVGTGNYQQFGASTPSSTPFSQFLLQEASRIDFKERELVDFAVTCDFLHLLMNNPEEEMEWGVKSYNLKETLSPRFNLALLERLPLPDVQMSDDSIDPKEFYMDLVFNRCSFNKATIIQALTMFKKDDDDTIIDQDWNLLKTTAMNIVDREIAIVTSTTDFELSDEDFSEIALKYWLMFYDSCVEYHIVSFMILLPYEMKRLLSVCHVILFQHTVKPLGLFYETNTRMICIVKKSRISFLRSTDSLETYFYFPHCVPVSENIDGQGQSFSPNLTNVHICPGGMKLLISMHFTLHR